MQSSNIPSKIPLPFAYAAGGSYVNPIPTASQIGVVNGRASLHDGFPPLTFTPIGAGGVPPFGSDMNGILNEITAIQQWQEAGGFFPFDATFASAIGGYPKGAIIQSSLLSSPYPGLWMSIIENNSNAPDSGGAGWVPLAWYGAEPITMSGTSVTPGNLIAAYPILILTGTLTSNCSLILPSIIGQWIIVNNTTGAYTAQVKTASGTGVNLAQNSSTYVYGDGTNIYYADSAKVASFNGRTGAVTLNATDVVNALGFTPIPQFSGLGYNGTQWNDVTGSRGYGITYTNSRSYPISVIINFNTASPGASYDWSAAVNGLTVWSTDGNAGGSNYHMDAVTFIVPPGQTYQANMNSYYTIITRWVELY